MASQPRSGAVQNSWMQVTALTSRSRSVDARGARSYRAVCQHQVCQHPVAIQSPNTTKLHYSLAHLAPRRRTVRALLHLQILPSSQRPIWTAHKRVACGITSAFLRLHVYIAPATGKGWGFRLMIPMSQYAIDELISDRIGDEGVYLERTASNWLP
jgi:hypothetical protein